jgi:hypothetical protein
MCWTRHTAKDTVLKLTEVPLHHTSTLKKLRVLTSNTLYQDNIVEGIFGSPVWMIICDTIQLNGLRICQGNTTHPY